MIGPIVTHAQYRDLQERYAALRLWRASQTRNVPDRPDLRMDNDELSAMEVYEFCQTPPDAYFLYIDEKRQRAQTWTGDDLGRVEFGPAFRDNLGSTRVPVRLYGINGFQYHGTYFKSAGDYARVKRTKRQPTAKAVARRKQA